MSRRRKKGQKIPIQRVADRRREALDLASDGSPESAQLQSKAGNRAVVSLLARSRSDALVQRSVDAVEVSNSRGYVIPEVAPPRRAGGKKLPVQLRAEMESSFGTGFGNVRVHQDEEMADALHSVAFTVGNDIHFGRGNYQPHSGSGRQVVAHELTHVLQQRSGRVHAPNGDGLPVNTERNLEAEAERLGRHAAWRLPVRVKGTNSAVRKPVDVTAQTDRTHSSLRSSPAE